MALKITEGEFNFFAELVGEKTPNISIRKSKDGYFSTLHRIQKIAPEQQNVFGWASVGYIPTERHGVYRAYTDWQGDVISGVDDIEKAAYDFTLHSRDQGVDHIGSGGVGSLIESFVSTPEKWDAMGIPHSLLPIGWWAGFHVENPVAWDGVKKGKYRMFSVQGQGRRIEL